MNSEARRFFELYGIELPEGTKIEEKSSGYLFQFPDDTDPNFVANLLEAIQKKDDERKRQELLGGEPCGSK